MSLALVKTQLLDLLDLLKSAMPTDRFKVYEHAIGFDLYYRDPVISGRWFVLRIDWADDQYHVLNWQTDDSDEILGSDTSDGLFDIIAQTSDASEALAAAYAYAVEECTKVKELPLPERRQRLEGFML